MIATRHYCTVVALFVLAACGGSGSDNALPPSATPTPGGTVRSITVALAGTPANASIVNGVIMIDGTNSHVTVALTPLDANGLAVRGLTLAVAQLVGAVGYTVDTHPFAHSFDVTTASRGFAGGPGRFAASFSGPACDSDPDCTVTIEAVQTPLLAVSDPESFSKVVVYNTRTRVMTPVNAGVAFPGAVFFNSRADLFVVDVTANTVLEYLPPYNGPPIATIADGIDVPTGNQALAFDASDDLFVANNDGSTVTEYPPPYTGAPIARFNGVLLHPGAIFFDRTGDMWVVCEHGLVRYAAPVNQGSPAQPLFAAGLANPIAIGQDTNGIIYVTDAASHSAITFIATGLPTGDAFLTDPDPNFIAGARTSPAMYVATPDTNSIQLLNSAGATVTVPHIPGGLATDVLGNLFVADRAGDVVEIPAPVGAGSAAFSIGGSWVMPSLPAVWP